MPTETAAPKTVVMTGVSRGLGLAVSRRIAALPEYRLVGLSRSLTDDYQALIDAAPERIRHIRYDADDIAAIPGVIREITQTHGPIYGLINNAAVATDGVLATMHASDIARVLRINLEAPLTLCKYASRSMLKCHEGRIINVSSIIASTGFNGLAVYGASKAGLEGMTRSLSRELGKLGITVNCVAPGYMETAMTAGINDRQFAQIRRRAPLGLPSPDDTAGAVMYLLGPDGARTTGTVVTVDGGSTA